MMRRKYGDESRRSADTPAGSGSAGDRCTFMAHGGRCCLRGQIGQWGKLLCSFHYDVTQCGTPHTKAEFAVMIQLDRDRGFTFWDHLPFEAWWEKIVGRAPFPENPLTTLQAVERRLAREQEEEQRDQPVENLARRELAMRALEAALSFRPRSAA